MIGATVKTTLGPCGMDKLVYSENGTVTISNDGATVMKLLDIVHPAAKTLVDIARSQDDEVCEKEWKLIGLFTSFCFLRFFSIMSDFFVCCVPSICILSILRIFLRTFSLCKYSS
jgi:hypothetical protein